MDAHPPQAEPETPPPDALGQLSNEALRELKMDLRKRMGACRLAMDRAKQAYQEHHIPTPLEVRRGWSIDLSQIQLQLVDVQQEVHRRYLARAWEEGHKEMDRWDFSDALLAQLTLLCEEHGCRYLVEEARRRVKILEDKPATDFPETHEWVRGQPVFFREYSCKLGVYTDREAILLARQAESDMAVVRMLGSEKSKWVPWSLLKPIT